MVKGDGCPLDNYGLSMIAVSITMEGEVNTITCRWNHDNGGNDSIMTIEQLEDVIGRNFYQTFKPYTIEELHAKGFILFDEVQELLDYGKAPREIFDRCFDFLDGFARVKLNDKYNFINTNGQLISDTWFDGCGDFDNGVARVYLNDKYNFINTNGQLISDTWFDYCGDFYDGFAIVELNDKWNFINTNGQLISDTWFDRCFDFLDGFARVKLNDKYNFINTNGQLISDTWFDGCNNFINGFAVVRLNGQEHYINTNGQIVESKGRKKIKKAIAAQDQVGGKVNAGVMDAVAHGGGMCESIENGSLETWYRGYDSKYPNLGVPKNHGMWMTDNIEYAKTYAEEFGKYGKIAKITIDWSKISWATEGEIYDLELDVYDSDEDTCRIVKQNGYNAWICDYYSDGARGLCLIDSSPIVSIEDVDESEYSNYVEENVEKDT